MFRRKNVLLYVYAINLIENLVCRVAPPLFCAFDNPFF